MLMEIQQYFIMHRRQPHLTLFVVQCIHDTQHN